MGFSQKMDIFRVDNFQQQDCGLLWISKKSNMIFVQFAQFTINEVIMTTQIGCGHTLLFGFLQDLAYMQAQRNDQKKTDRIAYCFRECE